MYIDFTYFNFVYRFFSEILKTQVGVIFYLDTDQMINFYYGNYVSEYAAYSRTQ